MSPKAGAFLRPGWSLRVVPAVVYLLVAFVMGSVNLTAVGGLEFQHKDKLLHVLVFAGMQWTHGRVLAFGLPGWSRWRVAVVSAVSAILAGATLEGWQFLLPHRTADVADILADAIGASLAAVVWGVWALGANGTAAEDTELLRAQTGSAKSE